MVTETILQPVERDIAKTESQLTKMALSESAQELRDAWEDFLTFFHRAVGKIITISLRHKDAKSFGHQLKNLSAGKDEGLLYLREARHSVEHGIEPFAVFRDPMVIIGNVIGIRGDAENVLVSDCIFNIDGVWMKSGSFVLSTKGGKITKVLGKPMVPVSEVSATVLLKPIPSARLKRNILPPRTVLGKKTLLNDPFSLAQVAIQALNALEEELEQIIFS